MAGEQTATQTATPPETATVTTTSVTDAALSAAFDAEQPTGQQMEQTATTTETETTEQAAAGEGEQTGEQTGEQQAEQTETGEHEEPADNAERSRLGRRLKTIEEKFDAMLARMEQQTGAQPPAQPAAQQPAQIPVNVTYDETFIEAQIQAAVDAGNLPATIMTPQDQVKVNQFVTGLQQYMGNQYAVGYLNTLKAPTLKGTTPDDVHAEVLAELQKVESPFNLRRYNNPQVDAQVNYLEAKTAILEKRMTATKPTGAFKGKPARSPATGTSVSTRTATAGADELPPLDEASLDFIKRTGMSTESVKAALKGDMPLSLRGRLG